MSISRLCSINTDSHMHTAQEGKHIWGLPNFFWQCIFHHAARVHRYEWAMWCLCACVCSLSLALIGLDNCVENTDGCCFCFFRQTCVTFYTKITGRALIPRTLSSLRPPPSSKKQPGLAAQTEDFLPSSCLTEQYQQPAPQPPFCVPTRLLFWNN